MPCTSDLELAFTVKYRAYIETVQATATIQEGIYLLFAPIGTNAMFLANQIRFQADLGLRSVIKYGAYPLDKKLISEYNLKFDRKDKVLPWVLQRDGKHQEHMQPWNIWFNDISKVACASGSALEAKRELQLLKKKSKELDWKLLELSVCLSHVLRFNAEWRAKLAKSAIVKKNNKTLAVHIRRGDSCSEDMKYQIPGRKHFSVDYYIDAINLMVDQHGFTNCFVMSESQKDIDHLCTHFKEKLEIISAPMDRSQFITPNENLDVRNFAEYRCLNDPEFTSFLNESALIDLYNAGNCDGFVGAFTSQFSLMLYGYMSGNAGKLIPYHNLDERSYHPILMGQPSISRKKIYLNTAVSKMKKSVASALSLSPLMYRSVEKVIKRRLYKKSWHVSEALTERLRDPKSILVIKERDVGFFSLFLQVVNVFLFLKSKGLKCQVYVDFGCHQVYYNGENTWTQFFKKEGLDEVFLDQLTEVRLDFQEVVDKGLFAISDEYGLVYQVGENCFWTNSYYPNFSNSFEYISHATRPSQKDRKRTEPIIREWMQPVRAYQEFQANYAARYFDGNFVIGVQFRGTDARKDRRRTIPSYSEVFRIVQSTIDNYEEKQQKNIVLFVASDEQSFVDEMSEAFKEKTVLSTETVRQTTGTNQLEKMGPMGWGLPSFVVENGPKALDGVFKDYLLLCYADVLIHSVGSVASAVLLSKPKIVSVMLGDEIGDHRLHCAFPKKSII